MCITRRRQLNNIIRVMIFVCIISFVIQINSATVAAIGLNNYMKQLELFGIKVYSTETTDNFEEQILELRLIMISESMESIKVDYEKTIKVVFNDMSIFIAPVKGKHSFFVFLESEKLETRFTAELPSQSPGYFGLQPPDGDGGSSTIVISPCMLTILIALDSFSTISDDYNNHYAVLLPNYDKVRERLVRHLVLFIVIGCL